MKVLNIRLKMRKLKEHFFLLPVFVVMILSVSSIILCDIAFFYHAVSTLENSTQKQNVTFLNNISKDFSNIVLGAERICKRLYFDKDVRYYLDKDEISVKEEQVETIQNLIHSEIIRGSKIHSIYVYYQKQDTLITEDEVVSADWFQNDTWLDYCNMEFGARMITPVWTVNESIDGKRVQKDVVSVIRCFPVYKTNNLGAVVVNVEIGDITDEMKYLDKTEQTTTLMLNNVGIVQMSGNGNYDKGCISNILGEDFQFQQTEGQEILFHNEPVKIYFSETTYFGWKVIQLNPTKNLKEGYNVLWRCFYIAFLLCFMGIAVLLLFYFRIRKVNLVNGKPIKDAANLIKAGFPMENYYVLYVRLKVGESTFLNNESDEDMDQKLEKINREINSYCVGYGIRLKSYEYAIVINVSEKNEVTIQKVAECVKQLFKGSYKCDVGIAVGKFVKKFEELRVSFETAQKLDKYIWMKSKDNIVFYDEVKDAVPISYCFNSELEECVLENIRNGSERAAIAGLKSYVEDLKVVNKFCPENVYRGMLQITCSVYLTVQDIFDSNKLSNPMIEKFLSDPVMQFEAKESCQAVQKWLSGILKEVGNYLWEVRGGAVNETFISGVKEYIANHYNKGITLSLTAEEFNVSESYLSRTFKQKTGENFLTYLNKYRINMAKKIMLENRTLNIAEISNRVGFENVQTFIRVFKKSEGGITPGMYKELYLKKGAGKEEGSS